MNRVITIVGLLSVVGALTGAGAQQRPDFSGEWVRNADSTAGRGSVAATGDASFRRGDMGSGWGSPVRIAQQAGRLTVEYAVFSAYDMQPPLRFTYALDGSESRNSVMVGHASSELRSRVSWSANALVVTTLYPAPAAADGRAVTAELRQVLTLDTSTMLVVETIRAGVHGGATTTTRATYTRR